MIQGWLRLSSMSKDPSPGGEEQCLPKGNLSIASCQATVLNPWEKAAKQGHQKHSPVPFLGQVNTQDSSELLLPGEQRPSH